MTRTNRPTPCRLPSWSVLLAAGLLATACDDGQEPDSQPPRAVGNIPDQLLPEGRSADIDVAAYFSDPDGDALSFAATSSNTTVATVAVAGSVVAIAAVSRGAVKAVVTATDPDGNAAQQAFNVAVPATPLVELGDTRTGAPENGGIVVPLKLSVPPAVPISVAYTLGTDDDEGTADAGPDDFEGGATGSVEIEAGATEAEIEIVFDDDDEVEPPREVFRLGLDDPASDAAYRLGADRSAVMSIEEGVCDRTPEVMGAILTQVGLQDCAAAEAQHLRQVFVVTIPASQPPSAWQPDFDREHDEFCDTESPSSPRVTPGWRWPGTATGCPPVAPDPSVDPHPSSHTAGGGTLTTLKPGDFSGLDNLATLLIRGTQIETLPPDIFKGLASLRELALVDNRISELPEAVFSDLGALVALALPKNRIETLPTDMFSGLGRLQALFLDGNLLTAIPGGISGSGQLVFVSANDNLLAEVGSSGPPALNYLSLRSNRLTEVPSGWLSSPQMGYLDLSNNEIADLAPGAFSQLAGLQQLLLFGNRITAVPPGVFENMRSLSRLILADNEIRVLSSGAFSGLESLEWLALDRNRIAELPADALAGLPRLQRLWLSANQLTHLPPDVFADLYQLRHLALAINQLAEVPAEAFAGLTQLENLFLDRNQLNELPEDLLSVLSNLQILSAPDNRIAELPEGFFVGHSTLRRLALENNPGAPFSLNLSVVRTDSNDPFAPSPGMVAGRLALGAPFNVRLPLSVHGGELAEDVLLLRAGEAVTDEVAVTLASGQSGTQVSVGPAPRIPNNFSGISLELDDPLVLFGELGNHAPFAVREIPWFRLRAGGQEQAFSAASHFSDLDEDPLSYTSEFSNPGVVTVTSDGDRITVVPEAPGAADVTVTATDPGGLSASLSFVVTVRGAIPGSFDMEVLLTDSVTAEVAAAFEDAAGWWMTILADTELPDIPADAISRFGCDNIVSEQPVSRIDDLVVVASVRPIDGRGGVLAGARPCGLREGSMLPFMGIIQFDADDLEHLGRDDLEELILHEMGHVLGIGSIWGMLDLLREPSIGGPPGADTHFAGPLAVAAFDDAGGSDYVGNKVPVENQAGPGSGDVHWRQSVLVTELMTPFAAIGVVDALSAITIQSLADLGYTVNIELADPFILPGAAADLADIELIELKDDVMKGPIIVVDRNGRTVQVIGN